MRDPLCYKIRQVQPSGIRRFFDLVQSMEGVISLSVGEPDFDTPWHVRDEGIYSLEKGRTFYTPNAGLAELRREIAAVPQPSFVAYAPCAYMAGGTPVPLELRAEDDFRLTPEALRAAVTPKTKLLVLPFPNNPTGSIMRRADLEAIAPIIEQNDLLVLSDEIYSELVFAERHVSIASLPGMRERTVVMNGFSKSYAMTGWRLGYACGPSVIIGSMLKLHQYAIMSAPTTSQYAAIEALRNGDPDIEMMREAYNDRRRFVMKRLADIGLPCFDPAGAFYVFPSVREFGMTSEEFARRLLEEKQVAVVPGSAFGACGEGFLRISYAYSVSDLKRALALIEEFVNDLRKSGAKG